MLSPPTDYKPPCLRKRIQTYSVFSRSYISTWSYEGKPSIQDKRANVIYVMTFPSIWLASKSPCCGELTTGTSEQSPEAGRWDEDNSRLVSAWQHTGNYWQLGLATLGPVSWCWPSTETGIFYFERLGRFGRRHFRRTSYNANNSQENGYIFIWSCDMTFIQICLNRFTIFTQNHVDIFNKIK